MLATTLDHCASLLMLGTLCCMEDIRETRQPMKREHTHTQGDAQTHTQRGQVNMHTSINNPQTWPPLKDLQNVTCFTSSQAQQLASLHAGTDLLSPRLLPPLAFTIWCPFASSLHLHNECLFLNLCMRINMCVYVYTLLG